MSFEITERWLMDSGGWQAMKAARAAWQAGAVLGVEFDGTRLRGQVRSAGRTLAAGLVIKSRTDITNLCPCPQSRREGALCEHSLALGLAWVHRGPSAPPEPASTSGPPGTPVTISQAAPPKAGPSSPAGGTPTSTTSQTSGALVVALPATFFEGLRRNRLALSLRPAPAATEESEADRSLHVWLAAQKLNRVPPQLALSDRSQIESLLCALADHPRITHGSRQLAVVQEGFRLPMRIPFQSKNKREDNQNPGNTEDERRRASHSLSGPAVSPATSSADDIPLEIEPATLAELHWWAGPSRGFAYFYKENKLLIIKRLELVSPFFDELGRGRAVRLAGGWLARHGDELSEVFDLDEADPRWPKLRLVPACPRFRLVLEGNLRRLTARVGCLYPGVPEFSLPQDVLRPDPFPRRVPEEPGVYHDRNREAEAAAAARLARCGFQFEARDNHFEINSEAEILQFFAGDLAVLERDWMVEYGPRAAQVFAGLERITPQFREVAAGNDWLAFDLALVGSAGSAVSAAEARRWLQTGQGGKRLPNGKIPVLARETFSDLEEVLRDLAPAQEQGHFRIARQNLGYLESSLDRLGESSARGGANEIRNQLLATEWQLLLRDYQQFGARWMLHLAAQGWGGILADEMGLGKTVQTLAVVSMLMTSSEAGGAAAERRPCLVVAPTSLLGNWREEAARFAPTLKVLVVRSGERTRELAALGEADLVITSYQLLVRDIEPHRTVRYHAVVLDEAGFVRNPDTQAAKAVRQLRAEARFALTGTPIENSIRDLWALTDFVLPGYLGRREDFKERYEAPIVAGDTAVLRRLRRRMAPFWLRRLKLEVARELPAKIEKVLRCELTPTQRDIYAAIQREGVRKVEEARQSRTTAQARLTLLTALLRLRQTCGDPRLLGESFPGREPSEFSGKWAVLLELLEEIRDGGHNVLIFSQFATQLRLLEPALTSLGLDFCRLDGASRDREAQVSAFRDDPGKRAFLISLKAGGFGLNLTKADTVIHFDPWWNPAVEAQATDRAHRIGQARPVTVYKLIAAGTVEEKILALQHRKRQLMETALADDAAPLMDTLDDSALNDLLTA